MWIQQLSILRKIQINLENKTKKQYIWKELRTSSLVWLWTQCPEVGFQYRIKGNGEEKAHHLTSPQKPMGYFIWRLPIKINKIWYLVLKDQYIQNTLDKSVLARDLHEVFEDKGKTIEMTIAISTSLLQMLISSKPFDSYWISYSSTISINLQNLSGDKCVLLL